MGLKIVCSGSLVRYPMGGFCWHHLQYLVGLQRMGHEVTYFEHAGWPLSCYDPSVNDMTDDPAYGIAFLQGLLRRYAPDIRWCYLTEDGAAHGTTRADLAQACRECDAYLNLSNINYIDEIQLCRRRALIDTDPVFTQLSRFGLGGPWPTYHTLFTYGENVHRAGCDMPSGGAEWIPTRQPVVMDLWKPGPPDAGAPFTTVMNWSAFGDREVDGRVYGQKDRQFAAFFDLPRRSERPMEIAVNVPPDVRQGLSEGGWRIVNPLEVSREAHVFQAFLNRSAGEFCVAKHAYVSTRCGWFSDRTTGYLASGRPAVVEDTGFSDFLPVGEGLFAFRHRDEAIRALSAIAQDPDRHCAVARALVAEHFAAERVLSDLLARLI